MQLAVVRMSNMMDLTSVLAEMPPVLGVAVLLRAMLLRLETHAAGLVVVEW